MPGRVLSDNPSKSAVRREGIDFRTVWMIVRKLPHPASAMRANFEPGVGPRVGFPMRIRQSGHQSRKHVPIARRPIYHRTIYADDLTVLINHFYDPYFEGREVIDE